MNFISRQLKKLRDVLEISLRELRDERLLQSNSLIRKEVLTNFINNLNDSNDLPLDLVRQNLESSVIEIIYPDGSHCSCGLLITTDGYFITCYHCVNEDIQDLRILLSDGSVYPNLKLCDYSKKHDIALVKVSIPILSQAIKYPFYSNKKIHQSSYAEANLVVTMTRKSGKLVVVDGFSKDYISRKIGLEDGGFSKKQVEYETFLIYGDSGGVVVRLADLKVCGIASGSDSRNQSLGFYTQWNSAIEIVTRYANSKTGQQ